MGGRKKKDLASEEVSDISNGFEFPDIQSIYDSQVTNESDVSNQTSNNEETEKSNASQTTDTPVEELVLENSNNQVVNEEQVEELPSVSESIEVPVTEKSDIQVIEDKPVSELPSVSDISDAFIELPVTGNNSSVQVIDDNKTIESSNLLYEAKNDNTIVEQSNEKIENPSVDYTPHNIANNKRYVSYERRLLRYSILFIISFAVGIILLYQSLIIKNEEYINYTEKSNLDYRVFLKENDFYEDKFLNKDMLYVASLIDYIDIDYLYNFNISEKVDLDFNYNITAKLSIMDSEGKKTYLTKDYELSEGKNFSLENSQDHTIIEHISIDYDEYNRIANSFKSTYALDTTSKLSVYLNIDKKSSDEKIKELSPTNNMLIEIPLSEKSISIQMDYKDIDNNSYIVKEKSISISNYILVIISGILLILAFYSVIALFRLIGLLSPKKSKYDKYVNKLLRQYDRLIVNSYTCPNLKNYNIIKIKEFNELLDMRDNLKLPIMYYSIIENQKCYFYIVNNTDLYLLILKAVDLDK